MDSRRVSLAVGVGVTTAVVTGGLATELASAPIEFSVLVGGPVGLVCGVLAGAIAHSRLGRGVTPRWLAVAAGIAAAGYTIVALMGIRYAVATTRTLLSLGVLAGTSLLVGTAVGVATWLAVRGEQRRERPSI